MRRKNAIVRTVGDRRLDFINFGHKVTEKFVGKKEFKGGWHGVERD